MENTLFKVASNKFVTQTYKRILLVILLIILRLMRTSSLIEGNNDRSQIVFKGHMYVIQGD